MVIRDEILAEQEGEKRCGLKNALLSMNDEDREGVCEALLDSSLESTAITNWLKKQGYKVNRQQIGLCRKNCECGVVPNG